MITMDWVSAAHPEVQVWSSIGVMAGLGQIELWPDPSKTGNRLIHAQWQERALPFRPWGDNWLLRSFTFAPETRELIDISIQKVESGLIYRPRAAGAEVWVNDSDDESESTMLPNGLETREIAAKIDSLGGILAGYIKNPFFDYTEGETDRRPKHAVLTTESFRKWTAFTALSGSMEIMRYSNCRFMLKATGYLPFSDFPDGWRFGGFMWDGFKTDVIYAHDLETGLDIEIRGQPSPLKNGQHYHQFTDFRFSEAGEQWGVTVITDGDRIPWTFVSGKGGLFPWQPALHVFDENVVVFRQSGVERTIPVRRWISATRTMMAVMNRHLVRGQEGAS